MFKITETTKEEQKRLILNAFLAAEKHLGKASKVEFLTKIKAKIDDVFYITMLIEDPSYIIAILASYGLACIEKDMAATDKAHTN